MAGHPMNFITEANKEGHIAFTRNISLKENPYHLGLEDHLGWASGWLIAKTMGATSHPDDKHNIIEEQATRNIAKDVVDVLMEEGMLDKDGNPNFDAYEKRWFNGLDPRIQRILTSIKSHPQYDGQLEVMLLLAAKDGDDFIAMYGAARKLDPATDLIFRLASVKLWNVCQEFGRQSIERMVAQLKKDRGS